MLHNSENNKVSQDILDNNREHLSAQCEKVLEILKSGEKLTVEDAVVKYKIWSLPRRILDLKQSGYDVKSEIINRRFKRYFMEKAA